MNRTRYSLRKCLKDRLIINVTPATIGFHLGSNLPRMHWIRELAEKSNNKRFLSFANKFAYSIEPFLVGDLYFEKSLDITLDLRYQLMEDLIIKRNNIRQSLIFKQHAYEISVYGKSNHKNIVLYTENDLIDHINDYLLGLVDSMMGNGYDTSKSSDVGTCFISPSNQIIKSAAANHRFAVARILGIKSFPIEVVGISKTLYSNVKSTKRSMSVTGVIEDIVHKAEMLHQ
ncbi:MAG: hypothetical protein JJU48_02825 [Methylophaga sp.]|nr:hypothetical protein [Methylophaga sp.]